MLRVAITLRGTTTTMTRTSGLHYGRWMMLLVTRTNHVVIEVPEYKAYTVTLSEGRIAR